MPLDCRSLSRRSLSRRALLRGAIALAGACAAPPLLTGYREAKAAYRTSRPDLPPDFGGGRTVAIVGAGVTGLTAAYTLARAGFRVAVFEAEDRYGGRSLTPRPADEKYRDWWFSKYDPEKLFPRMYADRYRERPESPAPELQVCTFMDDAWAQGGYEGDPVELFLNAGPGRIASNHMNLIALCQEIGVALEPYFFLSMANLLQGADFNGGAPVPLGQINYSLYAEMAEMMAEINKEACKLQGASSHRAKQLANLYQLFGDLKRKDPNDPCTLVLNELSEHLGFSHVPGGWRDAGKTRPRVALDDILNSPFIGDASANPELSPGSYLFNGFNINWQPSLMQPVGGMDRIWQQLLLQDVPAQSMLYARSLGSRSAKVGDLVFLNTAVSGIHSSGNQVTVVLNGGDAGQTWKDSPTIFDYGISTMSPSLLGRVLDPAGMPAPFLQGLEAFQQTGAWDGPWGKDPTPNLWTPAIKVGWQGKHRFWETESEIYGGISWTTDIIGQIWYPSEDFTAHTGVLTGAYNRGPSAAEYAALGSRQRLETALHGLGLLHPGSTDGVHFDRGLSIAWQYMPHQSGGWASDTALESPEVYRQITTFAKGSHFYCAGDTWSYWPGWQEGSVASAYCAIRAIAGTIEPVNEAFAKNACFGTAD